MSKFPLMSLESVEIDNYDLYKCPLTFDFSKKLNIIFGTNGTGKSSLLYILLYSIIGPYRGAIETKSYKLERRDSRLLFSDDFYRDRMINPSEDAIVKINFSVNNKKFEVKHSLYETKLLEVIVNGEKLSGKKIKYKQYEDLFFNNNINDDFLIQNYHEILSEEIGVPGGMNSIIRLLLEAMLFDEERKFAFWQKELTTLVVTKYLVEEEFYLKYEDDMREQKYIDSLIRHKTEEIKYVTRFLDEEVTKEKQPVRDIITVENEIESTKEKLRKITIQIEEKNSKELDLKRKLEDRYEQIQILNTKWNQNFLPNSYEKYYSKFVDSMIEGQCPICGEIHEFDLDIMSCLLCGENLQIDKKESLIDLDIQRNKIQFEIKSIESNIKGIKNNTNQKKIDLLQKSLNELQLEQSKILSEETKTDHQIKYERLLDDKKRLQNELVEINSRVKSMNTEIEDTLLQSFKKFASYFEKYGSLFFGENQKVHLELNSSGVTSDYINNYFVFKLNDKERTTSNTLSESQRIFTDLAFRFSILSMWHQSSFFLCETPDSTLDMIYEDNAVETFYEYALNGNTLILTANARNSSLIKKIIKKFDKKDVAILNLIENSNYVTDEIKNRININEVLEV